MKILLLEPNRVLGNQYEETLSKSGHHVFCASDAQSALALADKHTPDLVILEIFLVGHSGLEFLYEFRSYTDWQKIPVIILSRTPKESINIGSKILKDLNVKEVLHKSETSLSQISYKVSAIKQGITLSED